MCVRVGDDVTQSHVRKENNRNKNATMTGRRKFFMHPRKVDKLKIEDPLIETSTKCIAYPDVGSSINEKKITYACEKKTDHPKTGKPYDFRTFYAGVDNIDKHGSEKYIPPTSNEVLILRQEMKDWKNYEDRANIVEAKLSKIGKGIVANESIGESKNPNEVASAKTTEEEHRRSSGGGGHAEHNGGGNIDVLPIQNAPAQSHSRHHNLANYPQLAHHRNSITDFNSGATRQQQAQQQQQMARHEDTSHEIGNGLRAGNNVRISSAHLTAVAHHVNLSHNRSTQLKRGLSSIDDDEHPEKRLSLEEQHPVRPPLTRGDSLPAVSLAVNYVQDRNKDKHPVRAPSFETATTFKANGGYVGPSIPLAPANVATNGGGGSPLRPRTSPPPPPPPNQEPGVGNPQSNHHQGTGSGPSPMAALMSVADTLTSPEPVPQPPNNPSPTSRSPPTTASNAQQRSVSRGSQHSPNSSGSGSGRRSSSSSSRHVSSTTVMTSSEGATTQPTTAGTEPVTAPALKCTLCQGRLEDTHFVQCPSVPHHKFCFPCSRDSIKRQGAGSEVYCPSGEKCPLADSQVPWAFMQGEIATILAEDTASSGLKVKKERET